MNKKASIDIGSNSTLLLILDISTKEVVEERSTITGLGRELDKRGSFLEIAMDETYAALRDYKNICEKHGISSSEIIATATEASRVASNAEAFYKKVQDELGIKVTLITGEGEAFYTAKGIVEMLSPNSNQCLVMDIGGASTELILIDVNPFKIVDSISLPVGSVRSTDWIMSGEEEKKFDEVFSNFDIEKYKKEIPLVCVAGTMTSLALMYKGNSIFDTDIINSTSVSKSDYFQFVEKISNMSKENIEKDFPFLGKRLRSIKGGAYCSKKVIEKLTSIELKFSTFGLRYGTVLSGGISENLRV